MGDTTHIAWTDATWNPVIGCSQVSPGCHNCYAEALATRWRWTTKPWTARNAPENVILKPHRLEEPLKWKEPKRVFVNSLSDVFHEQIPHDYVDRMFDIMQRCPQHTFQILTKRPDRMMAYTRVRYANPDELPYPAGPLGRRRPPANIWLGVSVEDQRRAIERIPLLLETLAAVRFISAEPLLGPLDLDPFLWEEAGPPWAGRNPSSPGIDWVIVGGESGPGHRPMQLEWAEQLRTQCTAADVAFFFKQTSGPRPGMGADALGPNTQQWPAQPERAYA